ncbi:biotin--[acetyl-CoA-carboxylase] ligase [Uliginosibacterium sp. sgz301328]|uniref:biotin--[acetyl-CoA-carboxylase] ligase n=1 Tax=Uliginosibacterium sp. sgz301328 TaxID=3243764 RepID=UPI00359D7A44
MPTELLAPSFDLAVLRRTLGKTAGRVDVEHVDTCTSTNTLLLDRVMQGAPSGLSIVADEQTAGRGRRGRRWQSAASHSLTFSLLWRFPDRAAMSGLSLMTGVAVARALERLHIDGIALKWPNDILLFGRKLGGILVEASTDARGAAAIIGIGLNLRPHPAWAGHIEQPFAALLDAGYTGGRENLLAAVLRELVAALDAFSTRGFISCRRDWLQRNAFQDLPVKLTSERGDLIGTCRGVDDTGMLLVETAGGIVPVVNGDVSLRSL